MRAYHDLEWGVPSHDDAYLFEMLVLEGAQAGLSWSTILAKRGGYRRGFAGFDVAEVARFGQAEIAALMDDPGVVRHRQKLRSAVSNAQAFLALAKEHGSAAAYFWSFVGGAPHVHAPVVAAEVPARTELSDALSKALRARGFSFVGSTIVYSFLQAVGMVDDHLVACPAKRRTGA
jgi:DNA-3-methyladenine glycosylase I